ncbi:MAG: hypothetical protein H7837_06570 [Magnetococcus sp. MYC-9]
MENAKETKNPLFDTYGTVVDRFFAPGKAISDPVVVFPGVESASQVDELPCKPDLVYFTPGKRELEEIQQTVERLRTLLDLETQEARQQGDQRKKFDNIADRVRAARGQGEGIQQVSFHLDAFRAALRSGDESLLPGNPFYALSKRIFRHNTDGALVLFDHLLGELSANAPEKMGQTRSLRTIWAPSSRQESVAARIRASMGRLRQVAGFVLNGLLFLVSAFTSYRALLALLQTSEVAAWLADHFTQNQSELLQTTLATLGGLLISVAVVDGRTRLLQGAAEMGAVFAGMRAAFLVQPRWIVLALCLSLFSVKANYDSMALLLSSQGQLSEQLSLIQQQVGQALGRPGATDLANPRSLHDLQALMQTVVADLGETFTRIPEEELTGKAASADPRKGPRYWAKYYIVNGGFVPGSQDVAHAFRDVQFARNMDQQLKEAGVPFDLPLAQKMQAIATLYAGDLEKSVAIVQKNLDEVARLLPGESLSLPAVRKILSFDNKQINPHIQEILQTLLSNRARFDQMVQALDKLVEEHVRILVQVDRSAEQRFNALRLGNRIAPPADIPLGMLSFGPIEPERQKSLAELSDLLHRQHGANRGTLLLACLLFLSVAIDGLPWLLACRRTARQGVADRKMAEAMLGYMKEWEDALIDLAKSFFYRPAIQQTLRGLTFPNETGVRNAFFKVLEEMDSRVKDVRDRRTVDQRRAWLLSLLRPPRSLYATGYNARATAIETFLTHREFYFPQLIRLLFPGLPYGKNHRKTLEKGTFLEFYRITEAGQAQDKERFAAELKSAGWDHPLAILPNTAGGTEGHGVQRGWLSERVHQLVAQLRHLQLPRRDKTEEDSWTAMVQQAVTSPPETTQRGTQPGQEARQAPPLHTLWHLVSESAFREPFPPFPHTRRNWLLKMSSVHEESLEDLDTLHDFIPDFVKMLKKVMTNTLPIIQESLDPLEDICARFPEQCAAHGIVGTETLKERFRAIEKESLGMWGACVSHLLGDGGSVNPNFQAVDNPELAGMLAAGGDISQFYERIHTLMNDAKEAAERAKAIEETTLATVKHSVVEIKYLCDSIHQMLIKINIISLDLRRQRPLPHAKLRALNEGGSILDRAPRDVKYILEAREKILASDNLFSDNNFGELSQLRSMAHALHNRVDTILNLVDK